MLGCGAEHGSQNRKVVHMNRYNFVAISLLVYSCTAMENQLAYEAATRFIEQDNHVQLEKLIDSCPFLLTHEDTQTPLLHLAAYQGKRKSLVLLAEKVADIDRADGTGNTPLHVAVNEQRHEIVQLLSALGADPCKVNALGETALHRGATLKNKDVCTMLLLLPRLAMSLSDTEKAKKRILMALWCMKQYATLPRDILFKIFTSNSVLLEDFAIALLLMQRTRKPMLSIHNTTAWRVLVHLETASETHDIVLEPQDADGIILDGTSITQCTVEIYGATWRYAQTGPLDVCADMQEHLHPSSDLIIHIDGGEGAIRQFTRPFNVSYLSYPVSSYKARPLAPITRKVLDAFAGADKKIVDESLDPRYLLKLPKDCTIEMAEQAYTRLVCRWEQEKRCFAQHELFADEVLKVLQAAITALRHNQKLISAKGLHLVLEETPERELSGIALLNHCFKEGKRFPWRSVVDFFVSLCLAKQAELLHCKDSTGATAYMYANQAQVPWAELLHPDHFQEHVGATLNERLASSLHLADAPEVRHMPDESLSSLALRSVGIEQEHLYQVNEALWRKVPEEVRFILKATKYAAVAPLFGAAMVVNSAYESRTKTEAALTLGLLPVAVIGSIPAALFFAVIVDFIEKK